MISARSERLFEFIIVAFLERDGAENASLSTLHATKIERFRNAKNLMQSNRKSVLSIKRGTGE